MEEPGFLPASRVAIVGLGLMGGSLAMALKGQCKALFGIDPDPVTLDLARQRQIVDRASRDPASLLPEAEVVILAAPVGAILDLIGELPELHPGSPILIDLGSTKTQICQAMEALPARFDPLGGHPMCGKEQLSLANADPRLYQGAPFVFTALERTSPRARALAAELAQVAGARPLWLDPQTHDRWVAATSHLPYLVASALAAATPTETAPLAGSGFRSTSRLAATPRSMMLDVLATNRENILDDLARFRIQLSLLEDALRQADLRRLGEQLDICVAQHRTLLNESIQRGGAA